MSFARSESPLGAVSNLPIRVFLAVLVFGGSLYIAFGRDPKTGRKVEEVLNDMVKYYGREKFLQKGVKYQEPVQKKDEFSNSEKKKTVKKKEKEIKQPKVNANKPLFKTPKEKPAKKEKKPQKAYFQVPALELTWFAGFKVLSVAFLAFVLAYLWGGGVHELLTTHPGKYDVNIFK